MNISEITSYRISKDTGLSQQSLDRYRDGSYKIKNMRIGVAEILYNYAKDHESKL